VVPVTRPSLAGIEQRAEAHQDWQGRFDSRERVETALASAADVPALTAAVRDVLAIHIPEKPRRDPDFHHTDRVCIECGDMFPCRTYTALAAHLDLTDPEGDPT